MQGAPSDRIDAGRLSTTLARVLPHTNRSAVALVDGVAIEMHWQRRRREPVAERRLPIWISLQPPPETIAPSVAGRSSSRIFTSRGGEADR